LRTRATHLSEHHQGWAALLILHISDADWQAYFELNVLSGVRLARTYLPKMLDRNWGRIKTFCE
jgi:NAD(P)-dependent dehydrogenase (short-subunit alcohol dehydrogenase family)